MWRDDGLEGELGIKFKRTARLQSRSENKRDWSHAVHYLYIHMAIFSKLLGIFIGGVWIFHGLYSKIINGIPRHKMIVARILGESFADVATVCIGIMEVLLGCWVIWGRHRKTNATIQTLGLISMNTLEIMLARDLLVSAAGMVALNLCFIALIWWWAARENYFSHSN